VGVTQRVDGGSQPVRLKVDLQSLSESSGDGAVEPVTKQPDSRQIMLDPFKDIFRESAIRDFLGLQPPPTSDPGEPFHASSPPKPPKLRSTMSCPEHNLARREFEKKNVQIHFRARSYQYTGMRAVRQDWHKLCPPFTLDTLRSFLQES
jgi:hypothetical protein